MAYDKVVDSSVLDSGLSQVANAIRARMILPILNPETTEWLPTQEGEGDPSMTNIRTVVGRDTVNVEQADGSVIQYKLPETVYGGSIDASGNVKKTWGLYALTGTENWHTSSTTSGAYWAYPITTETLEYTSADADKELVCDRFVASTMADYKKQVGRVTHDSTFCFHTEFATAEEWKAYLVEQYANGTPVKIAYLLKQPMTMTAEAVATMTKMSFPDGMASAISAIPSGGGSSDELVEFVKGMIDRTTTATHFPSELSGITEIGMSTFAYCMSLALTSLPEGITSIGDSAFYACVSLALTSLPSGLTSIGSYAFYMCMNLALTSLPSGLKSIDNNAFFNSGLKTLTFEGTPKSIANNAFQGCDSLKTINVPWVEGAVANAPWGATKATINYNYVGE